MTRICICGGGSLAHVCAGVLASRPDVEVRILTRRPELWSPTLTITDPDGREYRGTLACVSSDVVEVLRDCDIVLLCLPGYAIEPTLQNLALHLDAHTVVGSIVSSTGFFFAAHRLLPPQTPLFGFQRVPYIARTQEYGRSAHLLGYKARLAVAIENVENPEALRSAIEDLWQTPTAFLGSHYEASLTNSNPILHTGRLYTMWHTWDGKTPYDRCPLFYREWTDEASEQLIAMDTEFMSLLAHLPVTPGAIPPLLEYYDSHDAPSLTRKIRSIAAFSTIPSPMLQTEEGWYPDFGSRYFTEDFPYGLHHIVRLASEHNIAAPHLTEVYRWGMDVINRRK